jgi:hypothetical protein
MASVQIAYSGQYIRNATGGTADGAKLYVYDAQTEDLASIFVDPSEATAADNPVVADSAGLMPFRYKGTGDYKVILKTSAGITLDEQDNIPGPVETDTGVAEFTRPQTPVIVKTADYTTTTSDLGKVINANTTGGDVEITLLSAVTAADGALLTVRHTGTANFAKIVTTSTQTITHPATGSTTTALSLVGYGEAMEFVSDGANWHVKSYAPPLMTPNGPGIIKVADRLATPPGSPSPGARYILTSTPTDAWSTFAEHDIAEFTGQSGGWIKYTPPTDCGWMAYVQDEDRYYSFQASAWVLGADPAATTSVAGLVQLADQTAMEARTASRAVTADVQHFHPGHPKFWAYITNVLVTSYNVTSITDGGTSVTVTIGDDFSSANWCCVATLNDGVAQIGSKAAGSVVVTSSNFAGSGNDPSSYNIVGFGDL